MYKLIEKMSDNIVVHMLKAGKTFEGTTREVCDAIGREIDEDIGKWAVLIVTQVRSVVTWLMLHGAPGGHEGISLTYHGSLRLCNIASFYR